MDFYPFPAQTSKYKLNISYLQHDERVREKNVHFFMLSGGCLASTSFVSSSVQKLLLVWFLEDAPHSSPTGGGGSHSLYSLEKAWEGVTVTQHI